MFGMTTVLFCKKEQFSFKGTCCIPRATPRWSSGYGTRLLIPEPRDRISASAPALLCRRMLGIVHCAMVSARIKNPWWPKFPDLSTMVSLVITSWVLGRKTPEIIIICCMRPDVTLRRCEKSDKFLKNGRGSSLAVFAGSISTEQEGCPTLRSFHTFSTVPTVIAGPVVSTRFLANAPEFVDTVISGEQVTATIIIVACVSFQFL